MERLLNGKLGDRIDSRIMQFFTKRWKKLLALNRATHTGFIKGSVVTDKHYCKPIPHHFQQKILSRYQENVNTIKAKYILVMD